ncbi:uncharacterized protein LOC111079109 [Drosophila obscura]|uniref:uncharacterized protein LOC111079109 n=1 Tax=Drosophila obscura TaxID=7282 RepID=UPI001BB2C5B4|nr:uncharacterized protein LOC111079109 [Drosophila obscura]
MKRHNAKAIAAAAAAAGVPSHVERKLSGLQSVPSDVSVKGPVLYVDVVKNMPKEEPAPVEPPHQLSPPEFSIFREDFPALPGGRPASVSSVPDDWTSMISDDEEIIITIPKSLHISSSPTDETTEDDLVADEPKSVYSLLSAAEELSLSSDQDDDHVFECDAASPKTTFTESDSSASGSSFEVNGQNADYVPEAASYVHEQPAAEILCEVSLIFSKQFIQEGVRQRSVNGSIGNLDSDSPPARCSDPPGFEKTTIHASHKTHYAELAMGGRNSKSPGSNVDSQGAFGLLGLASRLGVAQDSDLVPMVYGEDDLMSMETDYRADIFRNLHSPFAGPFRGLRYGLSDINFNEPIDRRMASRLGLLQPKITQMEAELLFYFFYNCPGDMMQMLAAAELAERNWRFHMEECLWLRRQSDNPNYAYLGFQESGEYNYFNKLQWKILPRYFNLDPEQIERTLSKEELFTKYGYHPQM